jgi:hypothetical protein
MRTNFSALMRLTEARVVLALLASIVLVDVSLRLTESQLSGNLAHVAAIPQIVADAGQPEHKSLLVLGNSLTNNGVAPQIVAQGLPELAVAKVTPDATGLWDWQCLLEHQVVQRPEVQFDTVVIGFAWHLLSDQTRSDASRLGALYCRLTDLAAPRAIGLESHGDIGEFIAARVLRTYALRDTLRNRLFQVTVPNYIQFTQSGNGRAGLAEKPPSKSAPEIQYTYQTFTGLVKRLRSEGTRVIAVAMPVQDGYQLDAQLQSLTDRGTLEVIDLRDVEGLQDSHFLDGIHLNSAGQHILSRVLAEGLVDELSNAT